MSCDDFQVAIEREMHGALPETESRQLADHLVGCDACRAYQATVRETERAMTSQASEAIRGVDWSKVERGVQRGILDALAGVVGAVVTGALVAGLIWFTASPAFRAERMLRVGGALGVTVVLVAVVMAYGAWSLVRMRPGQELLDRHRKGLRHKVALSRAMRWVDAALAILFAWRALTGDSGRVNEPVFYGVMAAFLVGLGVYIHMVKLPRALREQADLDPDRAA